MTNRALLVGINTYPGQPLQGCVNDVQDMADFLVASCGFDSSDVRLLVDDRATTDNIKSRLNWLVSDSGPTDRLFFHYSGHGTRFPIRNANGNVSSVHDAICPVDFDWTRAHALIDDDLRQIFDVVPEGTEFIFVSDSCNSGDLARAMRLHPARFYVPPADIAWRLRTAKALRIAVSPIQHDRCALISGCRSDQESSDATFGGRPNGACTYFLLQALKAQGGISETLTELVPRVAAMLQQNNYDQVPQLRGPDALRARSFLARNRAAKAKARPAKARGRARRRARLTAHARA